MIKYKDLQNLFFYFFIIDINIIIKDSDVEI